MLRLLSIEWIKLRSHKLFLILLVAYCLMFYLMVRGFTTFIFDFGIFEFNAYHYPEIWHRLAFLGEQMQIIVLAPIVVFIVCDEMRYMTLRKQIIDGLSESEFIIGKVIFLVLLVLTSTAVIFILGMIYGVIPPTSNKSIIFLNIEWLGLYFLCATAYVSIAMFISLVVKRAVPALVIFYLLHMVEALLSFKIDPVITQYLPFGAIDSLIPTPSLVAKDSIDGKTALILFVGLYIISFNLLSWFKLKRSSL